MAKLNFKYGAMNSGKSDSLIKAEFNYCSQGLMSICIKPKHDTKLQNYIISRTGFKKKADLVVSKKTNIREKILQFQKSIFKYTFLKHNSKSRRNIKWHKKNYGNNINAKKIDIIFVDEAQFLTPVQVDQLYDLAKINDISVIAYGLKTDFRSKFFPGTQRFFELSDSIEKLKTMCKCGSQAEFNVRFHNEKPVFTGAQIAIDDKKKFRYDSVCGVCFIKLRKKN